MSVNEKMTAIADTIRRHTEKTEKLTLDNMPEEINSACMTNYLNGTIEGYNDGYSVGYDEGKILGADEGYIAAIEEVNAEFLNIIKLQESYIYPTILFTFRDIEYSLRESEAFWTDKLSFPTDWSEQPSPIWNDSGYAKWGLYTIVDSQNNFVKYNDAIKNNEIYHNTLDLEFFIQCDDGNKYAIQAKDAGDVVYAEYLPGIDNRFVAIYNEFQYSGCYFTPENNKKYLISTEYEYIYLGNTINATLEKEGNA